jgi:hypothetical protein
MAYFSTQTRAVLVAHIDGPVGFSPHLPMQRLATHGLLLRGLLAPLPEGRPTHTVLTPAGRRVLGAILAEWAEALSRAGCGEFGVPVSFSQPVDITDKPRK